MAKKNKVEIIDGIRTVTPIQKKHDRPMIPPSVVHKSKKDYDRKKVKKETKKEYDEIR